MARWTAVCIPEAALAEATAVMPRWKSQRLAFADSLVGTVFPGPGFEKHLLYRQGIPLNYAEFHDKSMLSRNSGQIRCDHLGVLEHSSFTCSATTSELLFLIIDRLGEFSLLDKRRLALVMAGRTSWENWEANGNMHKLARLLSD